MISSDQILLNNMKMKICVKNNDEMIVNSGAPPMHVAGSWTSPPPLAAILDPTPRPEVE